MPIKGEAQRKIKKLKAGEGVKAPYSYWHNVLIPETKKEYPELSEERIRAIAGSRWKGIHKEEKIKIIRKWQPKPRRIIRRRIERRQHRRGY